MIFNEDKLQEEIIKTWGEFGVHNEVFKAMRKQISDLKQLTLTDVSNSNLPLWVRPLLMITTMVASALYIIYITFYCC